MHIKNQSSKKNDDDDDDDDDTHTSYKPTETDTHPMRESIP